MVKRKSYNLSLADNVLYVDKTNLCASAVKRNLAVITHNKDFALGNNLGNFIVAVIDREGCALNIRLVNYNAVYDNAVILFIELNSLANSLTLS